VLKDYNVYEEMLNIYSMDDQSLIHMEHIFQTKLIEGNRKRRILLNILPALYRINVYQNLIFVDFHEHKNPIHIMAFVHVLDHSNHKYINVLDQLSGYQQPNLKH
jgi:hypothetical protein